MTERELVTEPENAANLRAALEWSGGFAGRVLRGAPYMVEELRARIDVLQGVLFGVDLAAAISGAERRWSGEGAVLQAVAAGRTDAERGA